MEIPIYEYIQLFIVGVEWNSNVNNISFTLPHKKIYIEISISNLQYFFYQYIH